VKKPDLKTLYFNIFMTYTNSHVTLEDIGTKYGVSKQRVWQIIRHCRIGKGDYYRGLRLYNQAYTEYKTRTKNPKAANNLMRAWLRAQDIRLIKRNDKLKK
jgi:predicted DNA-binding protein YlxM (UPF0122 family)